MVPSGTTYRANKHRAGGYVWSLMDTNSNEPSILNMHVAGLKKCKDTNFFSRDAAERTGSPSRKTGAAAQAVKCLVDL